ncbi:hypothetical protein AJ80_01816 [Polytolypa hystricis UAMH7299]|uniref:Hydrophobin n=1 Tax=Polytolypa hystricis (strain UAMH7299) TaxID=1447883 RepID=A0A2B7Z0A2_POLH7|nr:hypothetical protein AJ80_01816 [Polytolypa hystricis UAMH7299]
MLSTTFTLSAALVAVVVSTLISNTVGVWTCPSGREPYCCSSYTQAQGTDNTWIGKGCTPAPRNSNCSDNHQVECCMVLGDNISHYCDFHAEGYGVDKPEK